MFNITLVNINNQPVNPNLPYFFKNIIEKLSNCTQYIQKKHLVNLFLLTKDFRIKRNREAICKVLCVLIRHMDAKSFSVVKKDRKRGGELLPMSIKDIAEEAMITYRRAKRAISDLIKAKYLKSIRQYQEYQKIDKETGEIITKFKGNPSIKDITHELLIHLGVTLKQIKKIKEWKKEALDKIKMIKAKFIQKKEEEKTYFKNVFVQAAQKLRKNVFGQKLHTEKIPESIANYLFKASGVF